MAVAAGGARVDGGDRRCAGGDQVVPEDRPARHQGRADSGRPEDETDLPERVLDCTSTNVPESELVLGYLPPDTSYAERHYMGPDGFDMAGTVILMGADRTSIHKPDYCLPGQGWSIRSKKIANLAIAGTMPYELPVSEWVVSNSFQTPGGGKEMVSGVYVFWFVADGEETPNHNQFMRWLALDLLRKAVWQRWAYVSYFSVCEPGQEDATFARMGKVIAASVPEFQPPPARH